MDEPPPALEDRVLAAFADPARSLNDCGSLFEAWRSVRARDRPERDDAERTFLDSLALKGKLDELEQFDDNGEFLHDEANGDNHANLNGAKTRLE